MGSFGGQLMITLTNTLKQKDKAMTTSEAIDLIISIKEYMDNRADISTNDPSFPNVQTIVGIGGYPVKSSSPCNKIITLLRHIATLCDRAVNDRIKCYIFVVNTIK